VVAVAGGFGAGFFWLWASPVVPLVVGGGVGVCLFFENCTVDASIFESLFLVFKFLRALGGCLGIRSR
jgi:hypothetical protein